MSTAEKLRYDTSEAAIFARFWESRKHGLTRMLARHVLKMEFASQDSQLMHQLALKNREGVLPDEERRVLDNYVTVGDLIAILQSKARKLLKAKPGKSERRG